MSEMSEPAKRSRRPLLYIIIGLVVACVVCVGIVAVTVIPQATTLVNNLGQSLNNTSIFMTDLISNNYTQAYGLIHPSAQVTFGGSPGGLQHYLISKGWLPTAFQPTPNVQYVNDTVYVNGTGTFGGTTKYVYFTLQEDNGTWKIYSMDVTDNPPTPTPVATAG